MKFIAFLAPLAVLFALYTSVLAQIPTRGRSHRIGPPTGGTWQPLANQPSVGIGTILLLTDGTVLCQDSDFFDWWKLTPDINGNYVNGTWSQMATPLVTTVTTGAASTTQRVASTAQMRANQELYFSATGDLRAVRSITNSTTVVLKTSETTTAGESVACYGPLYYGSAVLADGRVAVMGGEYNMSGSGVWTNLGAIYDPVANSWSSLSAPSGWSSIGDAESCILPNGLWALADPFNMNMALLGPSTLTWTTTGAGKVDGFDEEGWTLLPEGTILTVDSSTGTHAEKYVPATGSWISGGDSPESLFDTGTSETGPMVLRPDGTVFAMGGTSHTAVYTPGGSQTDTGSWVAGPEFPSVQISGTTYQLVMADAPACLLPDGNVLCCTSPVYSSNVPGLSFFEFDGANLNPVAGVPASATDTSYQGVMLMLPTGQVLWSDQTGDMEVYTPTGAPMDAWRPTITACPTTIAAGMSFTIQGTQLNGLSQCSAYGDDVQNATNYPLVQITNVATGNVQYARTHDPSTMAVATGAALVSTRVDIPVGIELGPATLTVVTNGISSTPLPIAVAPELITGSVTLQNYSATSNGVPVTVQIRNVGSTTPLDSQTVLLDGNGNFEMATSVAPGTYDVTAKASHWLRAKLGSQTLTSSGMNGLSFSLINGDINGDNTISLADFGRLKAAYGSVPGMSNWNPNADLDGNGSVGLSDFGILKLHYGESGAP